MVSASVARQKILLNDLQQEGVMTDRKAVEPRKTSDPPASQKVGAKPHSMRRTTDDVSAGEGLRLFLKHNRFSAAFPIARSTPSFTAVTSNSTPLATSSADARSAATP